VYVVPATTDESVNERLVVVPSDVPLRDTR